MAGGCCSGTGGGCSCPVRRPSVEVVGRGPILDFFPKNTTLVTSVAGGTYYSDPFDVTGYKTITVEVARVNSTPTAGLLPTWMETSSDLLTWTQLGGNINPPSQGVTIGSVSDPCRYVRLAMDAVELMDMVKVVWAMGVARRK